MADVKRLDIARRFEEPRPGRLRLILGDGFDTQGSVEYNLRRLYQAYAATRAEPPRLELFRAGRTVGEFTEAGLVLAPGGTVSR